MLKILFMKHVLLFTLCCCFLQTISAQTLPVKSATIFKNGRGLLVKSGTVEASNGRYSTKDLPNALFGTFWISSPQLKSVFSGTDSVETTKQVIETPYYEGGPRNTINHLSFILKNAGKPVKIWLRSPEVQVEGVFQTDANTQNEADPLLVFKTTNGKWLLARPSEVLRIEYSEAPALPDPLPKFKKPVRHLDLLFNNQQKRQEVEMTYLTNQLGWTPVYQLDLLDKKKSHLALRAEMVNDAEDLGDTELRLAVGIPNFAFATKPSDLVYFFGQRNDNSGSWNIGISNVSQQIAFDAETYEERVNTVVEDNATVSKGEDFYFYTIKPGNFPKGSRYQYPIFEKDLETTHYYECQLRANAFDRYQQNQKEEKIEVNHYAEFRNISDFPYTTGVVNISASTPAGPQPISQDLLPFTAAGAKCKVKIAQTPEIKVSHTEGTVSVKENVKTVFRTQYDLVTIEAEACVVNYKPEPVTLRIKRKIEGQPLKSDVEWTSKQEQATLRVNPDYLLEWEITLKPGEEKKWKYGYEVFVNL